MRHDYDAMRNVHVRAFTLYDAEKCIEDLSETVRELRAYRDLQAHLLVAAFAWLAGLTVVVAWIMGG